jgi:histone acetyltransferase (RNA polymerase elongator complex component)
MDIEDVINFTERKDIFKNVELDKLEDFVKYIAEQNPTTNNEYKVASIAARRKFKLCPKKAHIIHCFRMLVDDGKIKSNDKLERFMTKKLVRIASGVEVITVFTSPKPKFTSKTGEVKTQKFSCGKNCAYCPLEHEIKLNCIVDSISINENDLYCISIKSQDPIDEVRVITFINHIDSDNKLYCRNYDTFDDDKKTFNVYMIEKYGKQLDIGDKIICTKTEQSRSYISTEPGVRRANQSNYDAVLQFFDRASSLQFCGHIIDKLEILVLGGTWSHYPKEYQEEYIRDLYYAANIFYKRKERERLSLEEEISINQTAKCRIIGLTLETRPDCINKYEIERFRRFNCTRVQLGVQHIDNEVLKKIERGCYNEDTIKALKLLKKNCYKVDYHLMPDLPGSNYDKDKNMFDKILGTYSIERSFNIDFNLILMIIGVLIFEAISLVINNEYLTYLVTIINIFVTAKLHKMFNNNNFITYDLVHPELQADQWKIYPTEVTRWTKIYDWHEQGLYKPYAEEEMEGSKYNKMTTLILGVMEKVFPWIRLNRIIRDIPTEEIFGGNSCTNLRQHLHKIIKDNGKSCDCIRSREVKNKIIDPNDIKEVIRKYNGVEGTEYFISLESLDENTIYGFCRLRINKNNNDVMNTLKNCALIRELHVYGVMTPHNSDNKARTQHHGFGKRMLKKAEQIAYFNGIRHMAIISGVGVRQYYQKRGYYLEDNFMKKKLTFINNF